MVNGRRIKNRRSLRAGGRYTDRSVSANFSNARTSATPISLQSQTLDMTQFGGEPFVHKHETESVMKPIGIISNYLSETTSAEN